MCSPSLECCLVTETSFHKTSPSKWLPWTLPLQHLCISDLQPLLFVLHTRMHTHYPDCCCFKTNTEGWRGISCSGIHFPSPHLFSLSFLISFFSLFLPYLTYNCLWSCNSSALGNSFFVVLSPRVHFTFHLITPSLLLSQFLFTLQFPISIIHYTQSSLTHGLGFAHVWLVSTQAQKAVSPTSLVS